MQEQQQEQTAVQPDAVLPPVTPFRYFPFFNRKQAGFLLVLLAIIFYYPSIENEYALDDGIVIHMNAHVVKGARGIKDILRHDLYHSFYERMNARDQLQGGRYRPLSVISFALEQELIGPYRTGFYLRTEDANKNGTLDDEKVYDVSHPSAEANYEFNDYVDKNGDGKAQPDECYACWDTNMSFSNETSEDLNVDGVFNEIDCQVRGAWFRHFNNIWLYALACLLLYVLFANHFFPANQDLAFLAALLFTVHPVHSEVVANVRGRDDIFSVIFIALTLIFSFRYLQQGSARQLLAAALMFFLALMSKEYAPLLFILLPLALYVFRREELHWRGLLLPFLLFIGIAIAMIASDLNRYYFLMPPLLFFFIAVTVFAILCFLLFRKVLRNRPAGTLMMALYLAGLSYLALRLNAVNMAPGVPDTELLNNPYLLASGAEQFATKIYTLLVYLRLMIFPHPLVSDYSYNSIPYRQLADWDFMLSMGLHSILLVAGFVLTARRKPIGFAILSYFVFLLFVSNIFFPTGIMMLESHLFHASIGFAIAVAILCIKALDSVTRASFVFKRSALLLLLFAVLVLCGAKAWERSRDWKNDVTLFLKDVNNSPNSVLVLGNAGARWIDLADTREITGISLRGQDTTRFNDYNGTLRITEEQMKAGGYATKREAALYKGIGFLEHAVEMHPRYVNGYLNLGLAWFKLRNEEKAILNWKYAEHLYPDNPYLSNYYHVFSNILRNRGAEAFAAGDYTDAADAYRKWATVKPKDHEAWYALGGAYYNLGNKKAARHAWERAQTLNPSDTAVKTMLRVIAKETE